MSLLSTYKSTLSRKLSTSSENYYDTTAREEAINFAIREFTDRYKPKELLKKKLVTLSRDGTVIHNCDAYDSSTYGTFTAAGDASNITTDTDNERFGDGCVNFDVTVTATLYAELVVANLTSLDLSDLKDTGRVRLFLKTPTVSGLTSVTFYMGSSSGDYWAITVTKDINGSDFSSGSFMRLEFDWANATETGSPDATAIDYMKVRLTYTSSFAGGEDFLLDDIIMVGAGTKKTEYDYRIASIPSDLSTPNRVLKLWEPSDETEYIYLDSDLYQRRTGNIWTIDYNLTNQAQRIFVNTSTEDELVMNYVKDPTTLSDDTDESGLDSVSDELICHDAAKKLFQDAQDYEASKALKESGADLTRAWHNRYGLTSNRMKSRFERVSYHSRN